MNTLIFTAIGVAVGVVIGIVLMKVAIRARLQAAEEKARNLVSQAEKEVETLKKETVFQAKERWYKEKGDLEREAREQKEYLRRLERRLNQKEETLEKKAEVLENKERDQGRRERKLRDREESLHRLESKYNKMLAEELTRLESISQMSKEEAKQELMHRITDEARQDAFVKIMKVEDEAKAEADQKARRILSSVIQRISSDFVAETTVSVVDLPNDEMKGRIIGREGRNIRALELATGIDLIIDDTPEAVILSGFDPYRRELARLALEKLMADGRIHPGRIEDVVNKVKKEMDKSIREEGQQAAFELGVEKLHPEEINLLGRLKYRYSYSQNILHHSKEVSYLCGLLAAEVGANVAMAKRAGLLHDVGKAVDHNTDGSHTAIAVDILKRYNESREVINAVAAHHEDQEPLTVEAVLLQAADALSAARPGARREMLESYIKRLEKLEEIANSFKGVEKAYAIQAGREIRVIVVPEEVKDYQVPFLAKDVAKMIEKEVAYPGEIKVTVIRETRTTEFAR